MADNVAITAGSGTSIATDDVASVHYQKVKIDVGADGVSAPLGTSNPVPVAGTAADGAAASGNPVQIGGKDGSGNAQTLSTDTSGVLNVNITSSVGTTISSEYAEDSAHVSGDIGLQVLAVRKDTGATIAGSDGDYTPLQTDSSGNLRVSLATVAANSSVKQDDAAFTPGTDYAAVIAGIADETSPDSVNEGDAGAVRITLDRKLLVNPQPNDTGGLSIFRSLDLDETEEEVKTTPGQVYAVWFTNTSTVTHWLKFYNGIASGVTVGSTTPVITVGLPGNSSDDISGSFAGIGAMGIAFSSGITVAVTTGIADNDTGAPTANAVAVNVFYK